MYTRGIFTKICQECGNEFSGPFVKTTRKKYCSMRCRDGLNHRFFDRLEHGENGCWNWTGGTISDGYGSIRFVTDNGKIESYAHRVSWIIHRGKIPDGLKVLHHCDNPRCCNPDHLWLGTDLDNALDKTEKGRNNVPYGENAGSAKLKSEQVYEIRKLHSDGMPQRQIAKRFGIVHNTVGQIVLGRTWKRV